MENVVAIVTCKSAEGSTPVGTIFPVSGEDGEKGFRVTAHENACDKEVLTKKNCTAAQTHIVSKLPCSYGKERRF